MGGAPSCHCGRVKTVLVSHGANPPVAVVSLVQVRLLRGNGGHRLVVAGTAELTTQCTQQMLETVIPTVDSIGDSLDLARNRFELSVINLGVAAIRDRGVRVEGYSLDAAVALAMLSAMTQLPVRQDTVITGHVASVVGDIRPVRNLREKLAAAAAAGDISQFLCPALDEDQSLEVLATTERQQIIDAIGAASGQIRVMTIRDLSDLICLATTEHGRLHAALKAGYFADREATDDANAAAVLVNDLENSFWRVLESLLFAGHLRDARRLLLLRIQHQLRQGRYPDGLGARLRALVGSVTPAIRRRRGFFPLITSELCFEMGRLAGAEDQADAADLLCTALGRNTGSGSPMRGHVKCKDASVSTTNALQAALDAISAKRLAMELGVPVDEARAGFVLPGVIIEDYEEFLDTIAAFYQSMVGHVDGGAAAARPDEALSLLERAFSDFGGLAGARSEARFAVDGGMRRVLDRMTEQYKSDQRFKRVHRILKESLDPLDWDGQLEFMRGLLERVRPHLPEEYRNAPAARFVRRWEVLVRAYVESLDRMESLMRTF